MNRGRHKTKKYPKECYDLRYFNAFKQAFTSKEAELLIRRIREFSTNKIAQLDKWENDPVSCCNNYGFIWANTLEGQDYWYNKIHNFIDLKNKQNDRS